MSGSAADDSRRRLGDAADSLSEFRRVAGVPAPPEAASSSWRAPAEASVRAALEEARERARALESELLQAGREREALEEEVRRLTEAFERGALDAAEAEALRVRAAEAESRAAEQKGRAALMEAEYVRLESLRRKAERAAADAEESGRAVAETLRRELLAANAALDRAAAESGVSDGRAKEENESLRSRLDAAATRIQSVERERRLELSRRAGDASAMQAELQRALAVAAALRDELAAIDVPTRKLVDDLAEARRALASSEAENRRLAKAVERAEADAEARRARAEEVERDRFEISRRAGEAAQMKTEFERGQAVVAALRQALAAAEEEKEALRRAERPSSALPPEAEDGLFMPLGETLAPDGSGERPAFVSPQIEPVLDPGWARLLRLVRPPVEAAYAHLRRLSSTALTTGQKALLRMSAASIAEASDSLSSVQLALEEGPAPGAPTPALPALESSLAAWESAFRRRGVALAREWPAVPPDAAQDPNALRILIYHALRNVLEALPRGGRLTVRASRGPDGGLRIEFADDGPGFPAEWLERRFEPFAAPRRGRAGLGLSLVRRTLRRWGGDAEASNGPSGRGARLTMIFAPPPPPQPARDR